MCGNACYTGVSVCPMLWKRGVGGLRSLSSYIYPSEPQLRQVCTTKPSISSNIEERLLTSSSHPETVGGHVGAGASVMVNAVCVPLTHLKRIGDDSRVTQAVMMTNREKEDRRALHLEKR